jgi:hypothetical protein
MKKIARHFPSMSFPVDGKQLNAIRFSAAEWNLSDLWKIVRSRSATHSAEILCCASFKTK